MSENEAPTPLSDTAPPTRNIAGVKLRATARTIECDAGSLTLRPGERVVMDDRRGPFVATVVVASAERPVRGPLARILRRADARDLARVEHQRQREAEAVAYARDLARTRQLPIKVFRAEIMNGGERTLLYFSSEERVDFRELVRDISNHLRGRIEMRQVGVRDEAKIVGGIGSCGRELCCTTFLPQFAPVSIKMAKNQNLPLNPAKVSGQCGRLKCCLVYEDAMYVEAAKNLPRVGKRVETPEGPGRVDDLDILAGRVRVSFPDRPPVIFSAAEVKLSAPPAANRPSASGDDVS